MRTKFFASFIAAVLMLNTASFNSNAVGRISLPDKGQFRVFEIAAAAESTVPATTTAKSTAATTAAATTTAKSTAATTATTKTTAKSTAASTTTAKVTTTTKAAVSTTKATSSSTAAKTTSSGGSSATNAKTTTTAALSTTETTTTTVPKEHTVTVYNYDGTVIQKLTVGHGKAVDLSKIDTSAMNKYIDMYTQQGFSQWMPYPEKITEDTEIRALYRKMSISCSGKPVKSEYYAKTGKLRLNGLEIKINSESQVPVKQPDGKYKVDLQKEVIDITENCTTSPKNLTEAFKGGKTQAKIAVYPIIEDKEIFSFDITYFDGMGDVDLNGSSDAADSSAILSIYSVLSTGGDPKLPKEKQLRCDVDRNGSIDSADASMILQFYSMRSTDSPNLTWDEFLG